MSTTVDLSTTCGHCKNEEEHFNRNITWNVSGFFWDAFQGAHWTDVFRGRMAIEIMPVLRGALERAEELDVDSYDSSSGWGKGADALDFLRSMVAAAEANPRAVFSVFR